MMTLPQMEQAILALQRLVAQPKKQLFPEDIPPNTIKQAHVGEGVRYIRDGATADLPTEGEEPLQGAAVYFDYETNKLWIWNRSESAWKYVQLS